MKTFNLNDLVFVKDVPNNKKWLSGNIVAVTGPLSYQVEVDGGRIVHLNVDAIRARHFDTEATVDTEAQHFYTAGVNNGEGGTTVQSEETQANSSTKTETDNNMQLETDPPEPPQLQEADSEQPICVSTQPSPPRRISTCNQSRPDCFGFNSYVQALVTLDIEPFMFLCVSSLCSQPC